MNSDIEQLASLISSSVFLDELCFDSNQFRVSSSSRAELADLVLYAGTHALLIQVKERKLSAAHDESSLAKWFDSRVFEDGVRQLEDTHRFLKQNLSASVKNRRGDSFKISEFANAQLVSVVLYGSFVGIPNHVVEHKLFRSPTIGTIHFINLADFSEILTRTVTPGELISYLAFREMHIRAISDDARLSEKALFGRYVASPQIVDEFYDNGSQNFEAIADSLVDDTASVDLRPYLSVFRERLYSTHADPRDYYRVLIELGLLHRAQMREFKKRFRLCYDVTHQPPAVPALVNLG